MGPSSRTFLTTGVAAGYFAVCWDRRCRLAAVLFWCADLVQMGLLRRPTDRRGVRVAASFTWLTALLVAGLLKQ